MSNDEDAAQAHGPGRARGNVPGVRPETVWTRLWRPFWVLPMVICLGAAAVGFVLPSLEKGWSEDLPYVFEGGPDGARSMLGTIASAMISVTGLVFSITIVALQLASSQFTPRVLGSFLSNRITQSTLGVFTASFVFALTVLRSVRGGDDDRSPFVPQVSITLSFLLVIASVGLFLAFIHHITTSIQVSNVISRVGDGTLAVIEQLYPEETPTSEPPAPGPTWSPLPGTPRVVFDSGRRHGRLVAVDYDLLVRNARELDAVVTVDLPVGAFVPQGLPVLRVWGVDEIPSDGNGFGSGYRLGSDRTLRQDAAFGLRQLVDIAERALSPGTNDPTTAVQVIDELHLILRTLVQRESPSPYITDEDGNVRVVHHPQRVEDLLGLAVREIAHYGRDSLRIGPRLTAMLDDLLTVTRPRYAATIEDLRESLQQSSPG